MKMWLFSSLLISLTRLRRHVLLILLIKPVIGHFDISASGIVGIRRHVAPRHEKTQRSHISLCIDVRVSSLLAAQIECFGEARHLQLLLDKPSVGV